MVLIPGLRPPARCPRSGARAGAERRAAGALEAEILAILREADGPLSPGEVRQRLARPPAAGGRRGNCRTAPW